MAVIHPDRESGPRFTEEKPASGCLIAEHIEIRERELQDRKGYQVGPGDSADRSGWEAEAIWPAE